MEVKLFHGCSAVPTSLKTDSEFGKIRSYLQKKIIPPKMGMLAAAGILLLLSATAEANWGVGGVKFKCARTPSARTPPLVEPIF